jgi:hypothetical protein
VHADRRPATDDDVRLDDREVIDAYVGADDGIGVNDRVWTDERR